MLETASWGFPQNWVIISDEAYVLLEYTTSISVNNSALGNALSQGSGKKIKSHQVDAEITFYSNDIDIDLITEVSSDITMFISSFHTYTFEEPIITEYSFSDTNPSLVNMSIVALDRMVQKS
jgi:hypothetical protein